MLWKKLNVAFGKSVMNKRRVNDLYYNCYQDGREIIGDEEHPERPSMSTFNKNQEEVEKIDEIRINITPS